MGYGLVAPIIFWYLVIRIWVRNGRKIPLIFIGLWCFATFGFPMLRLPGLASSLTVIALGMILYIIDRYKTALSGG